MTTTNISAASPNTTKRGGPKGPRAVKPRFEVQGLIPRKKLTLELPETALKLLSDYAAFLSNSGGYTVSTDSIVERLVDELARDRAFKAFLARAESKPRPGAHATEVSPS
jgi:hypothetical protein